MGIVFNVMRYSIHDGPGIRTTVFFKGCPLSCKWCHNPEGFELKPEQVSSTKGAMETIGYEITVSELIKEINKDNLFYEESGGGVTFSGGEPFFQADFLLELLARCKKEYINTAIDTSGYCDTEAIIKAAQTANYFLFDIKFLDRQKHEKYCGVPNDLILENLKCLEETKTKILLRIPVIPSINDDMPEMTGIFEFINDFRNIETVHLLPYHNIQSEKYKRMGKLYELSQIPVDESPNMNKIKHLFNAKFQTRVGG